MPEATWRISGMVRTSSLTPRPVLPPALLSPFSAPLTKRKCKTKRKYRTKRKSRAKLSVLASNGHKRAPLELLRVSRVSEPGSVSVCLPHVRGLPRR